MFAIPYRFKLIKQACLCSLLLCAIYGTGYGQDHYWSQQYGGQAILMGGTSVAGVTDNSALFYNPGSIGFIDSSRVSATTFIFGVESVRLKNGAGSALDLKSVRLNFLPQMVTGSILIKKVPRLKLVYGTLVRGRTNRRLNQDNEGLYDVIEGSPGLEYYKAQIEYTYNSLEQWSGLGLAYKINDNWSVGLSAFGAYTNIETRSIERVSADAVANGLPYTTSVSEFNGMRLDQITQVFKLGVAAKMGHFNWGLSITTPGIKIWGQAKLEKSFEVYNLNLNASDTSLIAQRYPSFIISDGQKHLKSNYQIPFSASTGFKFVYPRFTFAAAIEYFMGYKSKTIVSGADRSAIRPVGIYGNDTLPNFLTLETGANYVINAGIGAEIKAAENIGVLMGARTDFSNRTDYLPSNNSVNILSARQPVWSYLYLSTGIIYRLKPHNLTVGFDYGLGFTNTNLQIYNVTNPTQNNYLRGDLDHSMQTSVHKLNFIFSYSYTFKPREKKFGPMFFVDEIKKTKKNKEKKRLGKK